MDPAGRCGVVRRAARLRNQRRRHQVRRRARGTRRARRRTRGHRQRAAAVSGPRGNDRRIERRRSPGDPLSPQPVARRAATDDDADRADRRRCRRHDCVQPEDVGASRAAALRSLQRRADFRGNSAGGCHPRRAEVGRRPPSPHCLEHSREHRDANGEHNAHPARGSRSPPGCALGEQNSDSAHGVLQLFRVHDRCGGEAPEQDR